MKSLIVLSAAALTTVVLSLPASATTVGCKPENPMNESVKATACDVWDQQVMIAPRAQTSLAYAPRTKASKARHIRTQSVRASRPSPALRDDQGVSGGSSD